MAETLQFPFQSIELVKRNNGISRNVLVASAGSKLYSYAAETGQRLAIWPADAPFTDTDVPKAGGPDTNEEDHGPPEKKRKVAPASDQALNTDSSKKQASWSNIPILRSTSNGEYVVALTAEDKCIRVFQIGEDGSFQQLSARNMPKRPCDVTFTNDGNTILSGDKFGDVYSLPLIPSDEPRIPSKSSKQTKPSGPSATPLTVHTQRNLRSLEMQKKMQALKVEGEKEKAADVPTFEHQLILGHVSLLTALAVVSLSPQETPSSAQKRSYILTADRDEHIRVSRGLPQAHVIENYCFGHKSFISALCIPQWAPEYLISGGGDNFLLLWKWRESQILQQIPLVADDSKQVAVRGIWETSFSADSPSQRRIVLVGIDGSQHLQCYTVNADGTLNQQESIQFSGNILDIQCVEDRSTILVSVDSVREPGSTQEWRSKPASPSILLEAFRLKSGTENLEWEPVSDMTAAINATGTSSIPAEIEQKQRQDMNTSVYSLENLRKKQFGVDE